MIFFTFKAQEYVGDKTFSIYQSFQISIDYVAFGKFHLIALTTPISDFIAFPLELEFGFTEWVGNEKLIEDDWGIFEKFQWVFGRFSGYLRYFVVC